MVRAEAQVKKIIFYMIAVVSLSSCGGGSDSSQQSGPKGNIQSFSVGNIKSLCLEGAYRNGSYCSGVGASPEMVQVCKVMSMGSGSCSGIANADLEKTCRAGLYGMDTCAEINDTNVKKACLAAAYGSADYCDAILVK